MPERKRFHEKDSNMTLHDTIIYYLRPKADELNNYSVQRLLLGFCSRWHILTLLACPNGLSKFPRCICP